MKNRMVYWLLAWLVCFSPFVVAQDEKGVGVRNVRNERKIALVIGNTNYDASIGRLKNPVNDAKDMAGALQRLGFTLVGGQAQMDVNKKRMLELIREFGRQIKQGGVGVFYFSGHGVQVDKKNYLIPLTDTLDYEDEATTEAVEVDVVAKEMELAENRLNILILDACRSNNLLKRTKNTEKGLAEPSRKPEGTLIAFAAREGQSASDGTGRNGLFTQELLKHLEKPNVRLDDTFRIIRNEVKTLSNGKQVPVIYDSTSEPITLNAQPQPPPTLTSTSTPVIAVSPTPKLTPKPPQLEMKFVAIAAGEFEMGSNGGESDEKPVRRVKISGFELGEHEVTQGQWQAEMGGTIAQQAEKCSQLYKKICGGLVGVGPDYPMYYVSHEEVQDFIRALNGRKDGYAYRLPTEAEWEYACRAGRAGDYAGNLEEMGWYSANSGGGTHPVKKKNPNAWGLYDMHGNVWEWTADWYGSDYYGKSLATNPTGPASGSYRVLRGGSWNLPAASARSALRDDDSPGNRSNYLGFRLARTPS